MRTMAPAVLLMAVCCGIVQAEEMSSPASILDNTGPVSFEFGLTNIYQQNLRGGKSTNDGRGRFAGSYDAELTFDLERLLGIEGAEVFTHAEGAWPKDESIDTPSVGSYFGVNGDAAQRESLVLSEFWYQQSLLEDTLFVRLGKMDITGGFQCSGCPVSFDCNRFANDETSQFLNSALVNNPAIPFPDYGIGAAVHYTPVEGWYLTGAAADAQADWRETGFNTAFHDEDYFIYMAETGITPILRNGSQELQGAYRVGFWYDPQPKANSDESDKTWRDDNGAYLSFDQMMTRENDQDEQGLGTFFRYGYAPSKTNDMPQFWSAGFQYQGLFDGRDEDVLGIGYARGYFSNAANKTYPSDYESAAEVYYNIYMNEWMHLTPSLQYVANPTSDGDARKDAVIIGLRAQITF